MSEQDKRPDDRGRPPREDAENLDAENLDVPEPDLHVRADDVELAEPILGPARISDETAAEADLAIAAAEAQAVEEEAEAAGRLVGGPRDDGAIKASGTAPAGAAAGDQVQPESAEATPAVQAPEATPPSAAVPPVSPADWDSAPASADGSAPEKKWYSTAAGATRRNGAGDDTAAAEDSAAGSGRNIDWKPLVIIGAVVVVAIVIIAIIVSSLTSSSPAGGAASPSSSQSEAETADADGVVAEDVSPFDFQQGQCFTEFEAVMRDATVVTCDTPHTAQLVGTFSYGADEEFPGADELNIKAQEVCTAVVLNDAAAEVPELKDSYGMPSKETWAQGDRRIDCFKIAAEGEQITGTLVGE